MVRLKITQSDKARRLKNSLANCDNINLTNLKKGVVIMVAKKEIILRSKAISIKGSSLTVTYPNGTTKVVTIKKLRDALANDWLSKALLSLVKSSFSQTIGSQPYRVSRESIKKALMLNGVNINKTTLPAHLKPSKKAKKVKTTKVKISKVAKPKKAKKVAVVS